MTGVVSADLSRACLVFAELCKAGAAHGQEKEANSEAKRKSQVGKHKANNAKQNGNMCKVVQVIRTTDSCNEYAYTDTHNLIKIAIHL